jgi:hypothetical protein
VKREHEGRAAKIREPVHHPVAGKVEVGRFIANVDGDSPMTRVRLSIKERAHNSVVEVDPSSRQFLCWIDSGREWSWRFDDKWL